MLAIDHPRSAPHRTSMRGLVYFLTAGVMLVAQGAAAQMQPHRAEYILRLGAAVNAPRVGTATQDLALDCDGWHLKRDIKGEVPISASWKFNVASALDSRERNSGDDMSYRSLQVQNGTEREVYGKVQRTNGELRAEVTSPDGPARTVLPALTLTPIASINYTIDKLRAGAASFVTLTYDAQGSSGDVYRIDIRKIDERAIRRRPPADPPLAVAGKSWPVHMSYARSSDDQQKPVFAFSARLFESGVLDRVTVDAEMITLTADLRSLEMRSPPSCQ
jgi:hypothetical protein